MMKLALNESINGIDATVHSLIAIISLAHSFRFAVTKQHLREPDSDDVEQQIAGFCQSDF
jgi:hypothetical protein